MFLGGSGGLRLRHAFDHLQMLDLEMGKTVSGGNQAVEYRSAM
jgi:hypothetical protein